MSAKQTGPTSLEGKARSSMNAIKHGYSSRKNVIAGETEVEYRQHMQSIVESYPIVTPAQAVIVEGIAVVTWRLKRLNRLVENNVHVINAAPVDRMDIEISLGKVNFDQVGDAPAYWKCTNSVVVDEEMACYLSHQKIVQAIQLWEDYQHGGDVYASELIDVMPGPVREIFDQQANEKSMQIDEYLDGTWQADSDVINKQLRIVRRASVDYMNQHASVQIKVDHWEAAKSRDIFETYNQPSYQRVLVANERTLNQLIGHYRQLSTMHIDQVPVQKKPNPVLNHDAITDVDVTH